MSIMPARLRTMASHFEKRFYIVLINYGISVPISKCWMLGDTTKNNFTEITIKYVCVERKSGKDRERWSWNIKIIKKDIKFYSMDHEMFHIKGEIIQEIIVWRILILILVIYSMLWTKGIFRNCNVNLHEPHEYLCCWMRPFGKWMKYHVKYIEMNNWQRPQ